MTQEEYRILCTENAGALMSMRQMAHMIHSDVNQTYGNGYPYGHHLDMVANCALKYAFHVLDDKKDFPALMFGAYFHDTIEDARLTYNDVIKAASQFMDQDSAVSAAEIVYALTNEKGRTRAERAGEKYYSGIRQTPYAPFVKMCDRLANTTFSCSGQDATGHKMKNIYKSEYPHFIEAITVDTDDIRFMIPQEMKTRMVSLIG